jgi:hypothetical protein
VLGLIEQRAGSVKTAAGRFYAIFSINCDPVALFEFKVG